MKRARWQKLTGYGMALGVILYAIHTSPASAAAIVVGGLVPTFITFTTGNVKEHQVLAATGKPEP